MGSDRDITANYHGGNPRSTEAFESTPQEVRATERRKVADYVWSRGADGATSDEVQAARASSTRAARHGSVKPRLRA